ncbi:class I adenylate-forming enzyme family protein [Chelatococcus asaccharovorans]|uniref:class I adenylate-forming enzyme family protein n=1 Tax=Chelatococcus asaccharovorans TaxID=28210 RepID=UPI00224C6B22|nr:AMP-binding protein [Chelatococcus asaccharovorans]CAH1649295.1 Fatty-acyl-CoA synthase/long-chain acyl-CoA synthetase [Chelatococcus asaccharovorans]CAH1691467.1 Fatty-acyl-CoA synthase/long-chain acyl-CoA synthetase [Chelatococcus asaccharovorans]
MNLASLLQSHARGRRSHPAIEQDGIAISYHEAAAITGRYAAVLAREDIRSGDRVGLCLQDSADHLLLHYAVAWLGATIVPIDYRWKETEKVAVAQAFACKLVVVEPADAIIATLPTLAFSPLWRVQQGDLPELVDDGGPIVLSLSSGTTGRPTGALVSHAQLYERFISQWVGMGFNASDRYLLATPLYFGGGRSFAMSTLAAGGTVVVSSTPLKAADIIATVADARITSLFLVPTQIGRMLDSWDGPGLALPHIRCLVTSGAAMRPGERKRVIDHLTPMLTDYYATSEGGGIAVLLPHEQLDFADTVGRPAFRVEIEVVDPDGVALSEGDIGILRYRGPGVSTHLVDGEGKVVSSAHGGWFAPGDLAQLTASGHVRLVGRIKDVIIRGGVNIYPAEIEATLATHPDIIEASVFGVPDKDLGEVIATAVVLRQGSAIEEDDIRAYVRDRLAIYKTPQHVIFTEELPRNPSGKVVRAELASLLDRRR